MFSKISDFSCLKDVTKSRNEERGTGNRERGSGNDRSAVSAIKIQKQQSTPFITQRSCNCTLRLFLEDAFWQKQCVAVFKAPLAVFYSAKSGKLEIIHHSAQAEMTPETVTVAEFRL